MVLYILPNGGYINYHYAYCSESNLLLRLNVTSKKCWFREYLQSDMVSKVLCLREGYRVVCKPRKGSVSIKEIIKMAMQEGKVWYDRYWHTLWYVDPKLLTKKNVRYAKPRELKKAILDNWRNMVMTLEKPVSVKAIYSNKVYLMVLTRSRRPRVYYLSDRELILINEETVEKYGDRNVEKVVPFENVMFLVR